VQIGAIGHRKKKGEGEGGEGGHSRSESQYRIGEAVLSLHPRASVFANNERGEGGKKGRSARRSDPIFISRSYSSSRQPHCGRHKNDGRIEKREKRKKEKMVVSAIIAPVFLNYCMKRVWRGSTRKKGRRGNPMEPWGLLSSFSGLNPGSEKEGRGVKRGGKGGVTPSWLLNIGRSRIPGRRMGIGREGRGNLDPRG